MDIEFRDPFDRDGPTVEEEYENFVSAGEPFQAAFGRMMLELLDALRHHIIGPRLIAQKGICWDESPELCLYYLHGREKVTSIRVTIDFKDHSPLVDGLPLLHYRLTHRPKPSERCPKPRNELRTRDVQTACEFILEAIRDCRDA
jgi:hypothetical protein